MAEKKPANRAQKAVTETKQKNRAGTQSNSSPKKSSRSGKKTGSSPDTNGGIPSYVFFSAISLAVFLLFLIIAIKPDGAILKFLRSIILGLIGRIGLYFAIPALLYTFFLLLSSKGVGIASRLVCLAVGIISCSCIHHLIVNNQSFVGGFRVIGDLYSGGADGTSGGVICGGLAMLLRWACGNIVSYLVLGLTAALTLLASMKITIPSVFRAIQNRPKDDYYQDEFEDVRPEPAEVLVNHLANKRIEQKRLRREQLQQMAEENEEAIDIRPENKVTASSKNQASIRRLSKQEMFDQIEGEIASPVSAAASPVKEQEPQRDTVIAEPAVSAREPEEEIIIPREMPVFIPEEPLPSAPKVQNAPVKTPAPIAAQEEKVTAKDAAASAMEVAAEIAMSQNTPKPAYCFPPIELLKRPVQGTSDGTAEMRENTKRLNETLASFHIDAHIINVTRGPSVTRYEVELDKGVRLNKLTTCADDIALSLGASGVRIAAIPGKISVVGIEVPNQTVTNVYLREVIDSPEFARSKSKSSFAVGKDIGGTCIVGNIAKMPHMLIAGTTGSGKSVCMNSIIISLLYKAGPEDVKLIMVDPKMVELGIYNGIPHLLIPVVTDPKKAAGSLQWAVTEMMRRYKIMSDAGVRDLESFNSIVAGQEVDGEKLPQVVIIIDELADLMLVAAKEVEDSICRIAQMGRAAGMHLIIATQRPSADVITGLMKANIPSRIAFAVASAMESRIILDTQGAEKLVGKGDMLYAPIGTGKPQRVQGCFVTDSEVEAVAGYVKENYNPDYNQEVLEEIEKKAMQTGKKAATANEPAPSNEELDGDEMLPAAVDVILETGQASVSMLQRRLKLGYARAARIVDEMEEKGIVGPFQGSKPRAILVNKEQWESMKSGAPVQMTTDEIPFEEGILEDIE